MKTLVDWPESLTRERLEELADRFWRKVDRSGECWTWLALKDKNGYGMFWALRTNRRAHRISWLIEHGEWPSLCVLHHCDNPSCVNPAHLFLGTFADNMTDKMSKGRGSFEAFPGESNGRAKLTEVDVISARKLAASGVNQVTLCKQYGLTSSAMSKLIRRASWRHLP